MAECSVHPWDLLPECRWCRAGMKDDTRVRLVVRVAEMHGQPLPGTTVEACAVCQHAVFVDRVNSPDPRGLALPLVCIECAMEDPDGRRQVLNMMAAVARFGAVLPPAQPHGRVPRG